MRMMDALSYIRDICNVDRHSRGAGRTVSTPFATDSGVPSPSRTSRTRSGVPSVPCRVGAGHRKAGRIEEDATRPIEEAGLPSLSIPPFRWTPNRTDDTVDGRLRAGKGPRQHGKGCVVGELVFVIRQPLLRFKREYGESRPIASSVCRGSDRKDALGRRWLRGLE